MRLTIKISSIYEQTIIFVILTLVFLYDTFVDFIGFLDESSALISFLILFFFAIVKEKLKFYRKEYYIILSLGIIATIGLLSNYIAYRNGHNTDLMAILGDFINFFKAFVVYLAIRLLSDNFDAQKVLNKLSIYAEIMFYFLLVLVIIDFIFKIFPHPPRYGVYSFELFFQHASRYSFAFAFIFLLLLPKYIYKKKSFLFFILVVGMLSLRVKFFGFATFVIIIVFYGKRLFRIPKIYFISTISSLGILMMWLFWDWFEMYFTFDTLESAWSRAVILYYSFIIGNDFFPLGTGFGTYSSYFSGVYYSWVYDFYSINKVYGISRLYWGFIADQYWPMVLGQFGYIGFISMLFIIYNYFMLFMSCIKSKINSNRYYYFLSAILGLLLLIIDSTTDAIFTQQRAVVMFAYFALIVNSKNEDFKK